MAKTSDGFTVVFRDQQDVPWGQAKRLMKLGEGNPTAEDLEYALAVMIKSWNVKVDGQLILPPTVDSKGQVSARGLDLLTTAQVHEITGLIGEAGVPKESSTS